MSTPPTLLMVYGTPYRCVSVYGASFWTHSALTTWRRILKHCTRLRWRPRTTQHCCSTATRSERTSPSSTNSSRSLATFCSFVCLFNVYFNIGQLYLSQWCQLLQRFISVLDIDLSALFCYYNSLHVSSCCLFVQNDSWFHTPLPRTSDGRLFQTWAAETPKAWSPTVTRRVGWTCGSSTEVERSRRWQSMSATRHGLPAATPCRQWKTSTASSRVCVCDADEGPGGWLWRGDGDPSVSFGGLLRARRVPGRPSRPARLLSQDAAGRPAQLQQGARVHWTTRVRRGEFSLVMWWVHAMHLGRSPDLRSGLSSCLDPTQTLTWHHIQTLCVGTRHLPPSRIHAP